MHRKKPYSGKKKKMQLKERKLRRNNPEEYAVMQKEEKKKHKGEGNTDSKRGGRNQMDEDVRLKTVFRKESQEVVEKRIVASRLPLNRNFDSNYDKAEYYTELLDIPRRPNWTYHDTKGELEAREKEMFKEYIDDIYEKYDIERLNYFEHNLDVWRQLWRTCEISDILLVLADIRHPKFHFPPSLYKYIVQDLKKPFILVLTKCDLVPEENIELWMNYFLNKYPNIKVTAVRSFVQDQEISLGAKKKRRIRRKRYSPWGVTRLLELCQSISNEICNIEFFDELNLDDSANDDSESSGELDGDEVEMDLDDIINPDEDVSDIVETHEDGVYDIDQEDKEFLTIGLIGHPNVGKSTLINALMGRTVCSTSRTPGHTKYRQTIFLTPHLLLCDCPGLIFPAVDMARQLQVLTGLYPIAQTREPYSCVGFIAERIPLEEVYGFKNTFGEPWSAWNMTEAYAEKKHYYTTKGRPDVYRAGNEILRDHLDGKVVLYFLPGSDDMKVNQQSDESDDFAEVHTLQTQEKKVSFFQTDSSSSEENIAARAANPFELLMDD